MLTTYRLDQTYDWNFQNGPEYDGAFPPVPATPQKDFFGIPVNSRLGIAAGLLLNSRWISTFAVSTAADAASYFEAGPTAVMMGSALMFDPTLAVRFKESHPEW